METANESLCARCARLACAGEIAAGRDGPSAGGPRKLLSQWRPRGFDGSRREWRDGMQVIKVTSDQLRVRPGTKFGGARPAHWHN